MSSSNITSSPTALIFPPSTPSTPAITQITPEDETGFYEALLMSVVMGKTRGYYTKEVLVRFQDCKVQDATNLQEELFAQAIEHSRARIIFYKKRVLDYIKRLSRKIRSSFPIEESCLLGWLQDLKKVSDSNSALADICNFSYQFECPVVQDVGSIFEDAEKCTNWLHQLRHNVDQLKQPRECLKLIKKARFDLPILFRGIDIRGVQTFEVTKMPNHNQSPRQLVSRMLSTHGCSQEFSELLSTLNDDYQSKLNTLVKPEWATKVHVELSVLDYFYVKNLKFFDDDRYIACSKAACYCCYQYIKIHPGKFAIPACHNNAYIRWKAPPLPPADHSPEFLDFQTLQIFRNDFHKQLTRAMRNQFIRELTGQQRRLVTRGDSEINEQNRIT